MDISDESVIELPADIVEKSAGFSFDIGATLVKLVYRSKQDYNDGSPVFKQDYNDGSPVYKQDHTSIGRARSAIFPRANLSEFIDFVKRECDYKTPDGATCLVSATGCGTSQFRQRLEKDLNIKIKLLPEWDAITGAFRYFVTKIPARKALHQPNKEGLEDADKLTKRYIDVMMHMLPMTSLKIPSPDAPGDCGTTRSNIASSSHMAAGVADETTDANKPAETLGDPVMLCIVGSSANYLKVTKAKNNDILSFTARSGGSFVGLGCLLLREMKTFDELIDLATTGDDQQVDICGRDLKHATDQGDVYSAQADDITICSFGQAASAPADRFKPEDMLASLLKMICADIIQTVLALAEKDNIRSVYFIGNFVNHEFVRRIITSSLTSSANMRSIIRRSRPIEMAFVRHGGLLGAIGCMMTSELTK